MDYDEQEIVFGDVPPGLESLRELPEMAIRTVVGREVIQAVYGQETATSFDSNSAVYAA